MGAMKDFLKQKNIMRSAALVVAGLSCLSLVACFGGVKKTGKVVGYQNGEVLTKKGHYQVGELPASWSRVKLGKAMVAFYNEDLGSTISTDSFCDQAYDDAPLASLTQQLMPGMQEIKTLSEESFMLGDRGALRTILTATMDGLPVKLSLVVVKKNWCLFDFFLVSNEAHFAAAEKDFEKFYQGFSYEGSDLP